MYLFSIFVASQIFLHSWIIITNYKKITQQQLIQKMPQDLHPSLVGKKIGKNQHSLAIITHKEQQYAVAQIPDQAHYIINPKPNNCKIGQFLPLFWRYAPEGNAALSSEQKIELAPSPTTLRLMNVHFIAGKAETLNTIRNGPNKNSLVLHYTNFYNPHCLLTDTSGTMLISTLKQIYDWFVYDTCFGRTGENEPFIHASALAPKSNRYIFICSHYSHQEHSLIVFDFIEKYKSRQIAQLPLAFEKGSTFYDLCFASGTILFCLINSTLYKFNLEKDGTITQKQIIDKYSKQPLKLISFSADPKFLSLGFMLKPKNEQGAYAVCACNLATGTYKKIMELHDIQKDEKLISPKRITSNGTMLGINFSSVVKKQTQTNDTHLVVIPFSAYNFYKYQHDAQ